MDFQNHPNSNMSSEVSSIQHEEKIAWYLINNHTDVHYKIKIGILTIGSNRKNHVKCQALCQPYVSPKHCYIELFTDGTIFLTDRSTHGTYINNIRVHRKIAKLYDNDEIIFAQDHHNTKFTLCRASYSIDENEVVHVMDDSESEGKFGDEHNSPSTSTSGTNKTNTNARPEPSSETVIWVSSDSDSLTLSDSSHNSILPITLKSIPGNSSGKTPITTSGAAPEIYMENHSVLSGSVSGDEPIVGTDTELVRFDAIPALHPPVVISVYHNYINEFHGTERFNPSPPVLLRNLLIIQACMASMAESVNLALDVIRAEVVAAENEVPSDTENSNDKSYGFDLFAISDCENEEVVEKNEDLNDFCEEILDEESKSGEDDVGRQEEENKNFIEQSCIDGKHEDLDKKMSSQDVVA